jgi:hypothetical protein
MILIQYSQKHTMINHCDRGITHPNDWYLYQSDLSWYVSDCTVSVSLGWVIPLSQWFIVVCFWLYCISITKMSDTSIRVIYHGMFLTTVSVSLGWVIPLSQWFIVVCFWLYCISITKISDTSIRVIYRGQKHTTINHCDRGITHPNDTDTVQSETYHDKSLW